MEYSGLGWYVVSTKPKQEDLVARVYDIAGIEYFFPKIRIPRDPSTPKDIVVKPLFPGYLFVHSCPDSEEWSRINYSPGVKHVVTFGGIPPRVPDEVISELYVRTSQLEQPAMPTFVEGDTVRVLSGPFRGLTALFKGYVSDRGRVRILLDFLRRCVEVETWAYNIEKVQ